MITKWTQTIQSTQRKVVNTNDPEKQKLTRRSIVYFVQPDDDVLVDEEFVFEGENAANHVDRAAGKRGMTAKDYVYMRASQTFRFELAFALLHFYIFI